jgi:hypothetical protein
MPRSSGPSQQPATQLSFLGTSTAAPCAAIVDAPPRPARPSPREPAAQPPTAQAPPTGESAARPGAIPVGATFLAFSFGAARRPAAERLAAAEARYVARYGTPAPLIAVPPGDYAEYAALGDPRVAPRTGLAPRTVYLLVAAG